MTQDELRHLIATGTKVLDALEDVFAHMVEAPDRLVAVSAPSHEQARLWLRDAAMAGQRLCLAVSYYPGRGELRLSNGSRLIVHTSGDRSRLLGYRPTGVLA